MLYKVVKPFFGKINKNILISVQDTFNITNAIQTGKERKAPN
jgi:hypothetical protein